MLQAQDWLFEHNLPVSQETPGRRLEAEARMYILIAIVLHPGLVPEEVVALIAEDLLQGLTKGQVEN